jgi:hypothetical protein
MGVRLLISSILYSGYVNRTVGGGGVCIVVVFGSSFEKNYFIKVFLVVVCLVFIYVWLKLRLKLRLNKK